MAESSQIHQLPVVFPSNGGSLLVGRIYRRTDDLTERQPTVLVTGSWLTVKEQMADRYARQLAARGFTAITFDFTGYGQSGGQLRQLEMPSQKIADITAAARFASTLSFVSARRIGYLGVCASAPYALAAIAGGAPISSFVSVAGWFHDTESVAGFYGGADGVRARLRWAGEALDTYLRTGELRTVPAYDAGNDRAGMMLELDYYGNPDRGAVPAWTNAMAEISWQPWLTFDGMAAASDVSVPSLFVHSDGCVFPDNVRTVITSMPGPAETVWSEGFQTDFYDLEPQVMVAVDAAAKHFGNTL